MVCERGAPEAWMQLARGGTSTNRVALLEDEWLQAGLREIKRGGKPVVPRADDDGAHLISRQ